MKSSRNSSRRNEIIVWLGVLACLFVTEIFLRIYEPKLSIDVAHIRGTAKTAGRIAEGRLQGRTQVLFIGNSLTRAGVDSELLNSLNNSTGNKGVDFHYFYPDGGNVGAWKMAWPRYFKGHDPKPDLVVLCGGRSHFRDIGIDPVIAGAYYLSWRQLPSVFHKDYPRFDDKMRLVASKVSVGFANRGRVQRRVRDIILPHNRAVLWDMATTEEGGEVVTPLPETSRSLEELLSSIRDDDVEIAVVSMPSYRDYQIPDGRQRLIESYGAHYFDLKSPDGIESKHYYDKAHLDEEGAEIFTRALFERIGPILARLSQEPRTEVNSKL